MSILAPTRRTPDFSPPAAGAGASRVGVATSLIFLCPMLRVRKVLPPEAKTVLGQFPTQIDYEDYREVDGVKLPFATR